MDDRPAETERKPPLPAPVGRLLCRLGVHHYRLLEVTFGIGVGNTIQKVICRRCGLVRARRS